MRELQVQHALVLRGVGVAFLHDVVAPGEIAVELAARSRRARDHQAPVPVVRQPQEEPRLALRVGGDARVELHAGHDLGDRRALARAGHDHAAIGDRREGERWQPGQRIVGRCRLRVGGGEVGAREAVDVREARPESLENVGAGDCRAGGKGSEEWKQCREAEHPGHDSLLAGPCRTRATCGQQCSNAKCPLQETMFSTDGVTNDRCANFTALSASSSIGSDLTRERE